MEENLFIKLVINTYPFLADGGMISKILSPKEQLWIQKNL